MHRHQSKHDYHWLAGKSRVAGSNIDDVSQENINNLVEVVDAYIQQPQRQVALTEFLLISQYLLAKNQQLTTGN